MTSNKPKILAIVGPTASGKTALSLQLAKKFSGEVISADSRQVYKELDIGTEKITPEEMGQIKHHLIDVCDPREVYTAADFKRDGEKAIHNIINRQNLPIIAGGTFFYVDTLLGKIKTPPVAPDQDLRNELEKLPTKSLFSALLKLDPRRAADIDPNNKRRLMRALEVVKNLGAVPPQDNQETPYNTLFIGIKTDKAKLRERIKNRALKAVERGLISETEKLLASGITKARLSEIGLEYKIVMEYLEKSISEAEMIQKLEEKNWQYAKKQLTWLKRMEEISWFELSEDKAIEEKVMNWLENN